MNGRMCVRMYEGSTISMCLNLYDSVEYACVCVCVYVSMYVRIHV